MAYGNLFHAEIGDGIYLISTDAQGKSMLPGKATTNSYLVVGDEKALLFDLAVDEPELLEYASSLAGNPVMLVLSHAHPDHIYHLNRWQEAWLHPADEKFLHGGILGMEPVNPLPQLHFLKNGDSIDLGSRIMDVIHIPGHTPGSILLLDRKTKLLLSGDTGARRLLYGITDFVPLDEFCLDLERLKAFDFEAMYSAHDRCALPKQHIDRMLDAIENDLPHASKVMEIPIVGKVRCLNKGEETQLAYFDMAILEKEQEEAMELYGVRINGLHNPIGFDYDMLLCSWKVRNSCGKKQAWARIAVCLDSQMQDILWEIEGDLNSLGQTMDMPLQPYTRYYYQITVRSDAGEEAKSQVCFFETAKLDDTWQAKWIGVQGSDTHPEFSKVFSAANVKSARLYICGLGIFEAYINGQKAGEDLLAPFINDYDAHFQYCTYDVTQLLKEENALSVLLGDGWWRGHFGLGEPTHYDRPLALIAELRIEHTDGTIEMIATDESWKYRTSFTRLSDIYNGEIQDYSLPLGNWKSAVSIEAPSKLIARYSPPVRYMETLPVKEVIHTPAGETVLDFGQNFAGHVVCSQLIPAGTTMTLEFGEILQNGNIYHDNYRNAESKFTYVSDGEYRQIRPRFTFFGFRYVKVSGLENIDAACFEGRAIYSQMDQTGYIHTGNEKINRLFINSVWGLKSNFLDMPTDCPQRDERLGWTGDANVFCTTAGFHMDTRAFYHKFLRDLRTDQLRNHGGAAIYLPNAFPGLTAGIWSDVATFMPKMLYDYYGSKEMLESHYPMMKDWVDYVYRADCARGQKNLYDFGFQFGDWLALDGPTEQSLFGRTDNGFVCSNYYYASTRYVADAASVLGLPEAAEYEERAEAIRNAILEEYFTSTGRLSIDTQTGYLVALKFGVYKDRSRMVEGLQKRFKQDLNRLKGGFVGATMMNCVLAENGMADKAYDLLFYEGFPGWLYAVNLGATTIWERWNSVLPDGSVSGSGMNSLNHYAYGSVTEFLYRYTAGIIPTEPGFRRVKIAPKPEIRLGHLECSYDSASGKYVSNWKICEDGMLSFHIEIPFGCEAELQLPEQAARTLTAGCYDFLIHTERDYRALYSSDTPYERLFEDQRAVAVLKQYVPEIWYGTDRKDREAMSKCLNDSKFRAALFRQPTESFDKAIQEISAIRA